MKMSKTFKFMSLFSLSLLMVACQAPKNETKPTVTKASPALTKSSADKSVSTKPSQPKETEKATTATQAETNNNKLAGETSQATTAETNLTMTQQATISENTTQTTEPVAQVETPPSEETTTTLPTEGTTTPIFVSYINTEAILAGDNSSLNGVWVNGYGHSIIFENGQLVGNHWIESGFVKNKSGSVSASCRSVEGFGALMVVVPAGIRSLHAEVDSIEQVIPDDRDYITVGTSLPRYEDRYYRVN